MGLCRCLIFSVSDSEDVIILHQQLLKLWLDVGLYSSSVTIQVVNKQWYLSRSAAPHRLLDPCHTT